MAKRKHKLDPATVATALDRAIAEAKGPRLDVSHMEDYRKGLTDAARLLRDLEEVDDEETQLPGAVYEETRPPGTIPDDDQKRWAETLLGAFNTMAEAKHTQIEALAAMAKIPVPDKARPPEPVSGTRTHLVPVKFQGRWVTAIVLEGLNIDHGLPVSEDETVVATVALMLDQKMIEGIEVDGTVITDQATGPFKESDKPAIGTGGVIR